MAIHLTPEQQAAALTRIRVELATAVQTAQGDVRRAFLEMLRDTLRILPPNEVIGLVGAAMPASTEVEGSSSTVFRDLDGAERVSAIGEGRRQCTRCGSADHYGWQHDRSATPPTVDDALAYARAADDVHADDLEMLRDTRAADDVHADDSNVRRSDLDAVQRAVAGVAEAHGESELSSDAILCVVMACAVDVRIEESLRLLIDEARTIALRSVRGELGHG